MKSTQPAVMETLDPRALLASVPAGFIAEPWGGRIEDISNLAFAPDGRLFVVTQLGDVHIIGTDGAQTPPVLTLDVAYEGEQGLSGLAFDPDFAADPWLYLYYTRTLTPTTFANEIARFRVVGNDIDESSRQVLMTLDTVVNAIHNGGAMEFGPDGKLYVAVGDGAIPSNAQNVNLRQGKILRLNKDGSIPADNPTTFTVRPTSGSAPVTVTTSGVYRSIWAMGLRNPFSIDFSPDGTLYIGDVGQENWEEVNVGIAGANYGWPNTRDGDFNPASYPEMTRPIYSFFHGTGDTTGNAIIGTTYYKSTGSSQFPIQYQDKVFFGEYDGNGWINYIDPTNPPADNAASFFSDGFAGMTDIEMGPDGALYVVQRWTNNPGVTRIKPNTSAPPAIVQQPTSATVGVGESASFSVGATGQAPLSYQWFRNDQPITGANQSSYTLSNAQLADSGATFHVRVTNGVGQVQSAAVTLSVTQNQPPVPTIIAPTISALASGGVQIALQGSATDPEDGVLTGAALSWKVDYYTGGLQRPFVTPFSGATGSFTPHTVTPYLDTDVFYRVSLTATDSAGRKTTVTRDVQPRIVTATLDTNPPGATLFLEGQALSTPFSLQTVAGVERELEAPLTFSLAGESYNFAGWSNGGARAQSVAPLDNTTYTASYTTAQPLSVVSIDINTSALPWQAVITFSQDVLASVDRYDFGLYGPTGNWITLPDLPLVKDTANRRATLTLSTTTLPNGQYTLRVFAPGITDARGTPLVSGATTTFSYPTPSSTATLSGQVFDDADNDGTLDTGETGAGGVRVWIDQDDDGLIDPTEPTTLTSAGGAYQFAGLLPGTYAVRIVLPEGYDQTTPSGAAITSIAPGQAEATSAPIGIHLRDLPEPGTSTIGGVVFDDINRSTYRDGAETGRVGVTVFIDLDNDGVLDTAEARTLTDAGGYYEFGNLGVGTYNIRAVRGNLVQTTPASDAATVGVVSVDGAYVFVRDIGLVGNAVPVLPAPTLTAATPVQPYLVRLEWTADTVNITGFVIERRTAGGAWAVINDVVQATSRAYNDWSAMPGVTYEYRVRAKDGAGSSEASNALIATGL